MRKSSKPKESLSACRERNDTYLPLDLCQITPLSFEGPPFSTRDPAFPALRAVASVRQIDCDRAIESELELTIVRVATVRKYAVPVYQKVEPRNTGANVSSQLHIGQRMVSFILEASTWLKGVLYGQIRTRAAPKAAPKQEAWLYGVMLST